MEVELPTGVLRVEVDYCDGDACDLLGFAARANTRRAFLFLSKVLGKHYPAKPSMMALVHKKLALQIAHGSGPIVFVGMAETATGLGQGVFEAWLQANSDSDALYLQTTRYRVENTPRLSFEESHSHAPRLFLHLPQDSKGQEVLGSATRMVLVDDELSTGNTLVNLARALRQVMPKLVSVHLATISDFMGQARRAEIGGDMGMVCSVGSIMSGHWQFYPNECHIAPPAAAQCDTGLEVCILDRGYGRCGRNHPLQITADLSDQLAAESVIGQTLLLGTGEFMHAAFVLGRALERKGVDVRVQASTRSPILRWGAIDLVLSIADPYGEGIPNFLYNVGPNQYGRVLICHELDPNAALIDLAETLSGRLIHFQANDHVEEVSVR